MVPHSIKRRSAKPRTEWFFILHSKTSRQPLGLLINCQSKAKPLTHFITAPVHNTHWPGRQPIALKLLSVEVQVLLWNALQVFCKCSAVHKTSIPTDTLQTSSSPLQDLRRFLQNVFCWYFSVNHAIRSWPVFQDSMPRNNHCHLT